MAVRLGQRGPFGSVTCGIHDLGPGMFLQQVRLLQSDPRVGQPDPIHLDPFPMLKNRRQEFLPRCPLAYPFGPIFHVKKQEAGKGCSVTYPPWRNGLDLENPFGPNYKIPNDSNKGLPVYGRLLKVYPNDTNQTTNVL